MRYFLNKFPDYNSGSGPVQINETACKNLIAQYVNSILSAKPEKHGDLYVGNSGISYMFLKLNNLENAKKYIDLAKVSAARDRNPIDGCSFLCGNAGIYAVSSVINYKLDKIPESQSDLSAFLRGFETCQKLNFNKNGSDELLFGRAGYLSGIYWLDQNLPAEWHINNQITEKLSDVIIESGLNFSLANRSSFPLLYHCWGDLYLGAAHGTSSIMHMLLESPLMMKNGQVSDHKKTLIKNTIDSLLSLQSSDGNFPCTLDDVGSDREYKLVHWCHGAPGVIYLMAKAFLVFKEQKYLDSCLKAGDLIWEKGLLMKGPGICHGVAGSGYAFLLLYRLTNDQKHLYRATKFMEFLTNEKFLREARTPDRPYSLYEGLAGTVCFLADLLEPEKASFPFMDVFETKF